MYYVYVTKFNVTLGSDRPVVKWKTVPVRLLLRLKRAVKVVACIDTPEAEPVGRLVATLTRSRGEQ